MTRKISEYDFIMMPVGASNAQEFRQRINDKLAEGWDLYKTEIFHFSGNSEGQAGTGMAYTKVEFVKYAE